MDLRDQLLRHRKDNRFIAVGTLLLLGICGIFYYLLLRGRGLPAEMASDKLLLFVLWYINIILILSIVFIIVRGLFRLLIERHNRILGSKFKTKLVVTAIALSLIPVLILFPFATQLLVGSFDQWFTLPIEGVVSQAADTALALSDQIEKYTLRDAHRVLRELSELNLDDLGERPALHYRLQELREELQLDYLAIYDGDESIHGIADPRTFQRAPELGGLGQFLQQAMDEGEAIRVSNSFEVEGRLILAACAHSRGNADGTDNPIEGSQFTTVVAGTVIPQDIAEKSESLLLAYQDYLQLETGKDDLRAVYLLNLLMVTLLVVLAFSSIGLRLARRITEPIQALADHTRRISSGDLDHQVEVAVDDELGVLVNAFNHMTQELKRNRELVDTSTAELRNANKRLAAVLQNVAAGVISLSSEGTILTCNGAALEILNQRLEDVVGNDIYTSWSDPQRGKLVVLLEEDFTIGGQLRSELNMTLGGVWKTLEVKVTTLPGSKDQVMGGRVVVLEDLTELIYAQKMATWNEVARRIAHEIKNPLTPIKLTAERLLKKHRQGDPQLGKLLEEGMEVVVREVSSMKNMVDEFSRFARMPRPRPQEVALESLVPEILGLYQGLKPGVEVGSEISPQANRVIFDPEQLRSVLINLFDNAIEATGAPGQVTLSTQRRNGAILIHIADTGRGVSVEDREKLFLPYYSTKGRGTGLGLSIVHRIVSDHNALIYIGDNEPQGAVFTLEIPQR